MRIIRAVVSIVALVAVTAGSPSALAGPLSKYAGGCSMVAVADPMGATSGPGTFHGVMTVSLAAYSTGEPDTDPVSATVQCYVIVNGWTQFGSLMTRSGAGVVTGAAAIFYTRLNLTDDVRVCTLVDYTSDPTPTTVSCQGVTTFEMPPPIVSDVLDSLVCPVFATVPGQLGPLVIDPQGDVTINGARFWDCPPKDAQLPPGLSQVDFALA